MSSTTQPDTCQHVRDVRTLTQLGLTHRTATGTAAALQEIAETKLACQKSCGDASPYRGQDINPHVYAAPTREDPVADTLIEIGRAARDVWRWMTRRHTAQNDVADGGRP